MAAAKSVDEVLPIRDAAAAMRAYAKQAKNRQLEVDAVEIRVRAERRVGELMQAQRETVGLAKPTGSNQHQDRVRTGPKAPSTLAEAGIDKHLADRARKLAAMPEEDFRRLVDEWRGRTVSEKRTKVDVLAPKVHISNNSGENEWYTPEPIITLARKVLGTIDLDPASSKEANKIVRAKRFFSVDDDGLAQPWRGNVWMNPPYSHPEVEQFCERLADHVEARAVSSAIILVNNATETQWFRAVADHASAVCFLTGRVRFRGPKEETAGQLQGLQGQAVLYIGRKSATFVAVFADVGTVWRKA